MIQPRDTPLGPLTDARPARRPGRVPLRGRIVDLLPMDPDAHADALFERMCGPSDDVLWRYMSTGPYRDLADFKRYLQGLSGSDDPVCFAIIEKDSGRPAGWVQYMRIEPAHRAIEVGNVMFSAAFQRTAGGTEAVYLMAGRAFEELGYRRFEWKCNSLNERSRRAAVRYGFKFEGVFRQHMIHKGRSRDTAWFSMIDSEWPERKKAFESWLHPSNFDEDGRQKVSLSSLNGV
jgi:RimJ/RimL family protein N-acetyltransferase